MRADTNENASIRQPRRGRRSNANTRQTRHANRTQPNKHTEITEREHRAHKNVKAQEAVTHVKAPAQRFRVHTAAREGKKMNIPGGNG